MKQRKHRLVVEFTTSHALTERDAAHGLALLLDTRLDLARAPIWATKPIYGEKVVVKEFTRVVAKLPEQA